MHVREARDEDIPAMSELLGVLFTQESEFTPDTERHKTGLRAILKDSTRGQLLVLEDEGKVVGMLNLLFLPSTALGITVGSVSYTHLRAHETNDLISYAVFC